jgi:hypothetical protein
VRKGRVSREGKANQGVSGDHELVAQATRGGGDGDHRMEARHPRQWRHGEHRSAATRARPHRSTSEQSPGAAGSTRRGGSASGEQQRRGGHDPAAEARLGRPGEAEETKSPGPGHSRRPGGALGVGGGGRDRPEFTGDRAAAPGRAPVRESEGEATVRGSGRVWWGSGAVGLDRPSQWA